MKTKLCACLLLTLLWQCPAVGQNIQRTSADQSTATINKAAFETSGVARLDLPRNLSADVPTSAEMSAAGIASRVLEFLASQNPVRLDGTFAGEMDAYLRPPHGESGYSDLVERARSAYDDATSIRSDRYVVNLDPLNMRCVLRLNLNRLGIK
jgi:hypothetical protein